MFDRDAIWALVGIGAALWALGGGGQKWLRRFVWPGIVVWSAVSYGVPWGLSVLGGILLTISTVLGYGESKSPVQRALVFFSFGAVLIPFGVAWWYSVITLGIGSALFYASRRYNWVHWKWWELTIGALQGFALAWVFLHR